MRHKKFEIRIIKDKDTGNKENPFKVSVYIHKHHKKSRKPVLRFELYDKNIVNILTELKYVASKKYSMSYALLYVNHENERVKAVARILLEVK